MYNIYCIHNLFTQEKVVAENIVCSNFVYNVFGIYSRKKNRA